MSTVRFNNDIVLTLPYGWASEEGWNDGQRILRIAGPNAGYYLSDTGEYECDIQLSVGKPVERGLGQLDFPSKLREVSDKAPDVSITVSVSSSFGGGRSNQIGGGGFNRTHRVVKDEAALKVGYFTMGILGKTACIGVIITNKTMYLLNPGKSQNKESSLTYMPSVLENVALLHTPTTPAEREAQRRAREQSEKERREREAAQRRREAETARLEEQRRQEQKTARVEAKEKRIQQEKARLEKEYTSQKAAANKKLTDAEALEREAQQTLSTLGFFQFGEKNKQKSRIMTAQKWADEAKAALDAAEKMYKAAVYELTRPADVRKILQDLMMPGVTYSVPDLMGLISANCDEEVSEDRVKRIMSSFCNSGSVVKTTVRGHDYYTLA